MAEASVKMKKMAAMGEEYQSSIILPDDIVAEILARFHIRPLFRFKLVSKRWNSLISNPTFGRYYLQRARRSPKSSSSSQHLWGMLYPMVNCDPNLLPKKSKEIRDIDHAPPSLYISAPRNRKTHILASSNGLLLSYLQLGTLDHPPSKNWNLDLCVSNPLTKQSVHLSTLYVPKGSEWALGLATRGPDNQTYVTYKVVGFMRSHRRLDDTANDTIMIFSSDKGSWTCNKMAITCPNIVFYSTTGRPASTCKGTLYWFDWDSRSVVTYDPYESPNSFRRIQFPSGSGKILINSFKNVIRLGDEALKYGDIECCNDGDRKLRVWRLVDCEKGEWCLEKSCMVSPLLSDSFLSRIDWRLVGPDPWNGDFLVCLVNSMYRAKAIDLMSAEEVFVDMAAATSYVYANKFVPIAFCPWSSPLYCRAQASSNSSPVVGLRNIYPIWFTSSR